MLGEPAGYIYQNPVFDRSFPDPFVLKFCGEYFAYCTGIRDDGRVFGVLRSRDLVTWNEVGGAMSRLDSDAQFYWAPEVSYFNGKFYLYYSVGNETLMEIRVAVSDRPDGGFVDSGNVLTNEEFAIDAHLFVDDVGKRYLFYATDFLEHTHIGTGTVVDEMVDLFTLRGDPKPVTRAKFDWQVYDPDRKEKGGVRWHTVEGPFILKRKGVYYEMFSGGNWQNPTYGVSFAVSDDLKCSEEWSQHADGNDLLPVLRTIPENVIGPGHNSVVRGPNNRELFCVYHQWHKGERVLSIDRMDFAGGSRLFVAGATHSPQPAPRSSNLFLDLVNIAASTGGEVREEILARRVDSFRLETSLKFSGDSKGICGLILTADGGSEIKLGFDAKSKAIFLYETEESRIRVFELAPEFDLSVFHLLRSDRDHRTLNVWLDEVKIFEDAEIPGGAFDVSLFAENCDADFAGTGLTLGFEELFENEELEKRGWKLKKGKDGLCVRNRDLEISNADGELLTLEKNELFDDLEIAINFAIKEPLPDTSEFSIDLSNPHGESLARFSFSVSGEKLFLTASSPGASERFDVSAFFPLGSFRQVILRRTSFDWTIESEGEFIGAIPGEAGSARLSVSVRDCFIAFDMIRVTAI